MWLELRYFKFVLLIIFASYIFVPNAYAKEIVHIELNENAIVAGSQYRLGDIARVGVVEQKTQRILEGIIVGDSPRVGYLGRASRSDIAARIETQMPGIFSYIKWHGATTVKIKRSARIYFAKDYITIAKSRIEDYLVKRSLDYTVEVVGEYRDMQLPSGVVHIKPRIRKNAIRLKRITIPNISEINPPAIASISFLITFRSFIADAI